MSCKLIKLSLITCTDGVVVIHMFFCLDATCCALKYLCALTCSHGLDSYFISWPLDSKVLRTFICTLESTGLNCKPQKTQESTYLFRVKMTKPLICILQPTGTTSYQPWGSPHVSFPEFRICICWSPGNSK